jgi:hypothetical protein
VIEKTVETRIAEVENFLDRFYDGGYKRTFSLFDYLKSTGCNQTHARQIAEYFRPLAEEASAITTDPDLKEAYSRLRKPQINKLVEQTQLIVADAERFAASLKQERAEKPRVAKAKPAAELVKNLQYLEKHDDPVLTSIDPKEIVGSCIAYLYNTRYKTLQVLRVKPGSDPLTVSGSTVKGFDPGLSFTKTIRKPDAVFPWLDCAGWKSQLEMLDQLKTKRQAATGRSNKDTILLKIVRTYD